MNTPLRNSETAHRRAGRWLRRFAAFVLFSGGAVGCVNFNGLSFSNDKQPDPTAKQVLTGDKQPSADSGVVQAKSDGKLIEWPDWEWGDFDLLGLFPKPAPATPPAEAFVVQGDKVTKVAGVSTELEAKLAAAKELFRLQDYAHAERQFHRIADNDKNPPKIVEEAKFLEAECLRFQDHWPKAADTYMDLMNKFPRNAYREQALEQMYMIANFWLDQTRKEMEEADERKEGKRWFSMPHLVDFDVKTPFIDREGHAIQLLEAVRFGDINGPLADKALFMCGTTKFYDENYKEADYYFTQISEKHADSQLVEKAIRLAIISKYMSTGGADYDGRKVAEARILIDKALRNYPNLNKDRWLEKQLSNVTTQQAAKDYKMAEFWERTGHPGAAVFYYDLVVRRYPGLKPYSEDAAQRRDEIMAKMAKEQLVEPAPKTAHHLNTTVEQGPTGPQLMPDMGQH